MNDPPPIRANWNCLSIKTKKLKLIPRPIELLIAPSEHWMFGVEKQPNGSFSIVTSYLRNPIGPSVLDAAGIKSHIVGIRSGLAVPRIGKVVPQLSGRFPA